MKIGLDIGSTTLKAVVVDENYNIIYKKYERHFSRIIESTAAILQDIKNELGDIELTLCISGSAGMGISERCSLPFVQEVYATRTAADKLLPGSDVIIELGGEDAKILFLTNETHTSRGLEVRMNGSCAGGTGAFIDQMATLLDITVDELNTFAASYEKIYTIASRCGVFAKTDVQPLLNQGARKNDISASILYAVVNQTIAGLAQGRNIGGKVVYLGGPLTFLSSLRKSFDEVLKIEGICPENSLYYVALGTAMSNIKEKASISEYIDKISKYIAGNQYISCEPLFLSNDEYIDFKFRHDKDYIDIDEPDELKGGVYVGIDSGSTTVKMVVIDESERIVMSRYLQNNGNSVLAVKEFLIDLNKKYKNAYIKASSVTGYGEELIKNAFRIDYGIVETIAHFTAASKFLPAVDFIIDIGGQDIKCFKIHNGAIDNIFLNEACSSGCGSFLSTFAGAWGMSISAFAEKGIYANRPVDLGSRCTVFMNSSVKQAQKDGASIENISAGLSISVVKNALYKVIRTSSADNLGDNIVVQGGTFLNDAVLRAFEKEIGKNVIRPNIAGHMGAFGCALYAKRQIISDKTDKSNILSIEELNNFTHKIKVVNCGLCANNCRLTVNTFDNGRNFIGGNRCEKPIMKSGSTSKIKLNMFEYKRELLSEYKPVPGSRGKIGIPMVLNFYELLPFWHKFFTKLGFEVITSPKSTRALYIDGQKTIPSDTVCYPAKIAHGHIDALIKMGVDAIFYPCMTYNLDEKLGDNHYNCPVVAYYPEVIEANVNEIKNVKFIKDYLGLHRKKDFNDRICTALNKYFPRISLIECREAAKEAYAEYDFYMTKLRTQGKKMLASAKEAGMDVIILAGRPYHIDEEISHGIDNLICGMGAAVITEDAVSDTQVKFPTTVLNQWTYHSRMYAAAEYTAKCNDDKINLVQLVSFGCGVDAITTDEMRKIIEESGKIYTQIKIDEITNLGAVKIRLRSLFAAINQKNIKKLI